MIFFRLARGFLFVLTLGALSTSTSAVPLARNGPTYLEDGPLVIITTQRAKLHAPAGQAEVVLNNPEVTFGDDDFEKKEDIMIESILVDYSCGLPPRYMPASAFAGLYDITDIKIERRKARSFALKIVGGDASASYAAEIEFTFYGVLKRTVFNRVSGYEEVTEYRRSFKQLLYLETEFEKHVKQQEIKNQWSCKPYEERIKRQMK
jgi:hypothetical protein